MGVNGGELLMVVLLFLLLFGAKAIPDVMKTIGKGMREFKKASEDIKREISETTSDIKKNIDEISSNVQKQSENIKNDITDSIND
jgi:sec-independent protein translocase protein TatA